MVTAIQFTGANRYDIRKFYKNIEWMFMAIDDWVVRSKGEYHVYSNELFIKNYEAC